MKPEYITLARQHGVVVLECGGFILIHDQLPREIQNLNLRDTFEDWAMNGRMDFRLFLQGFFYDHSFWYLTDNEFEALDALQARIGWNIE